MSIERNMQDFEAALIEMKSVIEALEPSLDVSLLGDLRHVIDEYEGNLQDDIQELIYKAEELEAKVEKLEDEPLKFV